MIAINPKLPFPRCPHKTIATEILDHAKRTRVTVVGDIIMDKYTRGDARRLSPEAPVPVVEQSSVEWCLGGAANVAANLRAMGANVSIVGTVGRDEAGERAVWDLSKRGIHVTGVVVCGDRHTTVKHRVLAGGRHIVRIDNEPRHSPDSDLREQILERTAQTLGLANGIIISDYRKGVVSDDVLAAVRQWNEHGNHVVGLDTKGERLLSMGSRQMKGFTFVKPNRSELMQAMKMPDEPAQTDRVGLCDQRLMEAINRWFDWTKLVPYLLVTISEGGMVFTENGHHHQHAHVPPLGSKVVEVSGAGDSVVAAFTLGLLHNNRQRHDFCPAVIFAAQAAAVAVGQSGTFAVSRTDILEAIGRGAL